MSPEQAKGQEVDRTTDVWAFGCVLFEMLTGRAAFAGHSVSEVISEVLRSEPEWTRLPADTPDAIRRLLRRCLRKDRRARLQHIGDARLEVAPCAPLVAVSRRRTLTRSSRRFAQPLAMPSRQRTSTR